MSGADTPKLWLALVEHTEASGTVPVLICSAIEPSNERILCHFTQTPADELEVTGMFDLTHSFNVNPECKQALLEYIAAGGLE